MMCLPWVTAVLIVWSSVSRADVWFSDTTAPEIVRAHEAALVPNKKDFLEAVHTALMRFPSDQVATDNLLQLIDAVYLQEPRASAKGLPMNWQLPKAVQSMQIVARSAHRFDEKPNYLLRVSVQGDFRHFDDLQVIRYPNQVLLDKKKGIGGGKLEDGRDRPDMNFEVNYDSNYFSSPIKGGLFQIRGEVKGERFDGWFILGDQGEGEFPQVVSPVPKQTISVRDFKPKWYEFISTKYLPFEQSSCKSIVSPENNQLAEWFMRTPITHRKSSLPSSLTLVEIDTRTSGQMGGIKNFASGPYRFAIVCDELRKEGSILVGREYFRSLHFALESD